MPVSVRLSKNKKGHNGQGYTEGTSNHRPIVIANWPDSKVEEVTEEHVHSSDPSYIASRVILELVELEILLKRSYRLHES